ncbi:MAG: choice-of-anchor Q domain-containing protein, partial [Chloroflexota bacterium]
DCYSGGTIGTNTNNLVENGSCSAALSGDPLLGPLANNGGPTQTHAVLAGSIAIDAGEDGICAAAPVNNLDQRGVTRPQGAHCDIGAYESTDTVAPAVVSILRAHPNPSGAARVDFIVTFSEDVTGVDLADFTLATTGVSGATLSGISGSGGVYTLTVNTGSGNGTIRLDLPITASITDLVGNPLPGLPYTGGEFYYIVRTAPVLIAPANGDSLPVRRPTFDWTDFPGAASYQIQVSKYASFPNTQLAINKTVTLSTYAHTANLAANTLYYWRVRAKVGGVWKSWSEVWNFTTGNPPSVPTLLAPANGALASGPSPLFDWRDSTVSGGAVFDHYQIQIATDNAFANIIHDHNLAGAANSNDNDAVLNPATTYYWRVRSFAADGDYSAWSVVRSVKIRYPAPTLLSPPDLSIVGSPKPTFTWSAVTGATGYTIQISKMMTFGFGTINANAVAPTYTPGTNLLAHTKYYWRVRATGTYGPSDWSIVFSFTTP